MTKGKLILSTFHVSDTTRENDRYRSFPTQVAPFYRPRLQAAWRARCRRCRGWIKRLCLRGSLEVDVAGGCVVELIGACELHDVGLITCVGCAIVKGDHAPDCGVAQGVVHGVTGHHGKKQEEEEA